MEPSCQAASGTGRRVAALLAGAALTLVLLLVPVDPARAQPTLEFVNDPLKFTVDRREAGTTERCPPQTAEGTRTSTANATVFLTLGGSDAALSDLAFRAEVKPEKGRWGDEPSGDEVARSGVDVCWAELEDPGLGEVDSAGDNAVKSAIAPSEVKPFVVFVEGHAPAASPWLWAWWFMRPAGIPIDESNLSGHLVVNDPSVPETVPGTLALRLNNTAPGYDRFWFYALMALCAVAAGSAAATLRGAVTRVGPGKRLGEVPFKDRWASNLTGGGAILGTILAAGILPDATFFMPKQQYLSLNVLFGLIVVLAVVLYNLSGSAGSFGLAAAAVLGAGVGQVLTVLFMLKEMQLQGSMPWGGVFATQLVLVLSSPLVAFLAYRNVVAEIEKEPPPPGPRPDEGDAGDREALAPDRRRE